ncbi:hypothetical protein WJW27_005772 [Escherichia coli]|nr:hypothetical protein vBEcoMphAPEC6_01005 [Escherichia phage ph0011]
MENVVVYVFEINNEIKYVINGYKHYTRADRKLEIYSKEARNYCLGDDSVEVWIDGNAEYFDADFYDDLDKSNDLYIYVENEHYYTNSLFDITDSTVYDTAMVKLLKIDHDMFNKHTICGLLDFFRNL